jgi:hypothetical protein
MGLIPLPYRVLLLAVFAIALTGFGYVKGVSHEQAQWEAAENARTAANEKALLARVASNAKTSAIQAATNKAITKGKDDEIARLTARVGALGRLRHGAGICGGPAAATEATGTTSGDGTNTSGGLVREDVDRDLKSLILTVETDFATGRACQAFAKENGFVP